MRLDTIACGPLGVNTYVVSAEDAATCAVIDPGDAAPVLERLHARGQQCTHILITHGHFDHIWGAAALAEATGAHLAVHELDAAKLQSTRASLALLIGRRLPEAVPDVLLHDGDTLACAGLTFRVLHTPGHSEGGVCYLLESERVIFCGDTVFLDGVAGRIFRVRANGRCTVRLQSACSRSRETMSCIPGTARRRRWSMSARTTRS